MKPNKHRLDTLDKLVKDTKKARQKITKPFYGYRAKEMEPSSKPCDVFMPMNRQQKRANKKK
ncbi:MAG: hypothetical protein J6J36_07275 [Clostridia bacterium]|nr:hypothetical protein [Clostridia bacterium]